MSSGSYTIDICFIVGSSPVGACQQFSVAEGYNTVEYELPIEAIGQIGIIQVTIPSTGESSESDGEITVENQAPYCPLISKIIGHDNGTEWDFEIEFNDNGDPDGQNMQPYLVEIVKVCENASVTGNIIISGDKISGVEQPQETPCEYQFFITAKDACGGETKTFPYLTEFESENVFNTIGYGNGNDDACASTNPDCD